MILMLDAGPLISISRRDKRAMALLAVAVEMEERREFRTTNAVLAQVLRSETQNLDRLLNAGVIRGQASFGDPRLVGRIAAAADHTDVVDVDLAVQAAQAGGFVLTSDTKDLGRVAEALIAAEQPLHVRSW